MVRSGASRVGGLARAGGGKVRTITKATFNATREPLKNVAMHEGVRLGGHGISYTLDSLIGWRALRGWLRPSTFYTFGSFVVAALTGGKWRLLFRNNGQGGLHHLLARGLDLVHEMIAPGSPSGTAGADADAAGNRRGPNAGSNF